MFERSAMQVKPFFLMIFVLLLSSCSVIQPQVTWPNEVPAESYFMTAYQIDTPNQELQTEEDYLNWVRKFYTGVNVLPGWLSMSEQVLENLQEPQRSSVDSRLAVLGQRISSEWSKDNQLRLITSRSANVWRDALLESMTLGDLDNYLNKLDEDVSALLLGEIENDDIYFGRYYADEFDDF